MKKSVSLVLLGMLLVLANVPVALGAWAEPPQVVPFIYSGVTFTHIQQLEYHSSDYQVIVYCPDSFVPKLEYNAYGQQMQLDYYHATANTCIYKSYNDFSDHTWYPTWGYYNGALISSQNGYSPDYSFRSTRDLYFKNETYNFYGYFGLYEVAANELLVEATEFAAGPPVEVLSPVEGPLEVVYDQGNCTGGLIWCFNQHGTGAHTVGGGVGSADDTYAWDINQYYMSSDSDNEKPVYATADGTVASTYGGSNNAEVSTCHIVLIQHTAYNGFVWWSGYLHMTNLQVERGDPVTSTTYIGDISTSCTDNNHLHFVVYKGTNSSGNLESFNPTLIER